VASVAVRFTHNVTHADDVIYTENSIQSIAAGNTRLACQCVQCSRSVAVTGSIRRLIFRARQHDASMRMYVYYMYKETVEVWRSIVAFERHLKVFLSRVAYHLINDSVMRCCSYCSNNAFSKNNKYTTLHCETKELHSFIFAVTLPNL